MMKLHKILYVILAAAAAAACQKDVLNDDGYDRFTVYPEGTVSRTVLDGTAPLWTPSDRISVYDGRNNLFSADLSSAAATAVFKGKLEGQSGRKDYLAAYPYDESYKFQFLSRAVYDMVLPAVQTAVKDSFDPAAALAISYTTDRSFSFRNVCSLVKFTIACDNVGSVELKSNGEEPLSGKFNASWNEGIPTLAPFPQETQRTVTLKGDFEKGATYFISVLPAVLANGFTLTLNGTVVTMAKTVPVAFSRSGLVNLGTVSLDPSENVEPETPDAPEEEEPAFTETEGVVTMYVEGAYDNFYMWAEGVQYIHTAWPGLAKADVLNIDGSLYSKFVFEGIDQYLDKQVKCIVSQGKDGKPQSGDSDYFTLAPVNVFRIDNNKPVIVQ